MTAALKSLTFTTLPKPSVNPTLDTRSKLIARLEDQKRLFADANYMRVVRSWKKSDSGEKSIVEKRQRVLQWWSMTSNGSHVFFVRSGWKAIEFEKGKAAIVLSSLDKLPTIIDTVIAAVRNGELDEQLAQASAQMKVSKSKGKRAA